MRKVRDLLLLGAGGFGREAAEAVRAINSVTPTFRLLGFLDDDEGKHGTVLGGLTVLGGVDAVERYPDAQLLLCSGRPDNYVSRAVMAERLALPDQHFATVVHPAATVGSSCRIGPGSVLLSNADLTADVTVGRHVVVMPQVVLTHDVQIGDYATIASRACLGGGCRVDEGSYIGSGACLRENLSVGAWSMIGMGSIVTRDVPAQRLWFGVPARDESRAPLPPEWR